MKLIRGIHNLDRAPHKCVLTIGNFDGVHRGHQALLKKLREEGKRRNLPVIVMIFQPQPMELFFGKEAPARLTRLRDKLRYLAECGVDYVLCIYFSFRFAAITAQNFISDLLVNHLGVQLLVVGDDFRFGSGRQGDFCFLKKAASKYGFDVASTTSFCEDGARISSTAIRRALAADQLDIAENLLGHPFSISGRVIHGNKLGRAMGFPTANISLYRQISPVKGSYAVVVSGINDKPLPGIANIGIRPTVVNTKQQLEVHLFDVTMNLYGSYINVILCKKIRDEQKFTSLDRLRKQIICDELKARTFFHLPVSPQR